jgi:hypothetical protein
MIKLVRLLAVVAIATAACGKDTPPPQATPGSAGSAVQGSQDCIDALDKVLSSAKAEVRAALEAREGSAISAEQKEKFERGLARAEKQSDRYLAILAKRCTEDKWSADVLTCLGNAHGRGGMLACLNSLPQDAQVKAQQDLAALRGPQTQSHGPGVQGNPVVVDTSQAPQPGDVVPKSPFPGSAGSAGSAAGSAAAAGSGSGSATPKK